jgi:hypothetical protein
MAKREKVSQMGDVDMWKSMESGPLDFSKPNN